jgi:hypothetical protein
MRKFVAAIAAIASIIAAVFGSTAISSGTTAITGTTEAKQYVEFEGLEPHGSYAIEFYAYHYPGDKVPYVLSFDPGSPANARGILRGSVLLSDLAQFYEGDEGPVYAVQACIINKPSYTEGQCTPYTYVGYMPESKWDYTG